MRTAPARGTRLRGGRMASVFPDRYLTCVRLAGLSCRAGNPRLPLLFESR